MNQERSLELGATPEAALLTCRRIFAELGWEVVEADGDRLVAIEVPFGFNCRTLPAEAEVSVRPGPCGRTLLTLVASVRGFGARRLLEARMAALEKRLHALIG
jgi:hypothetical protein